MRGISLVITAIVGLLLSQSFSPALAARDGGRHPIAAPRFAAIDRLALRPGSRALVPILVCPDSAAAADAFLLGEQIRALGESIREFKARHPELDE